MQFQSYYEQSVLLSFFISAVQCSSIGLRRWFRFKFSAISKGENFLEKFLGPLGCLSNTMGLAEAKRKTKLGPSHHAPSTWSKEAPTSSLGFKLMSSMGWSPGQGLGQDLQGKKDNVKYALKDDFLGIGAKKEYGGGLWRGTSEIDDLYKRLEVGSKAGVVAEVLNVEPVVEKVKLRGGWEMKFHVGDTYTSSFSRTETETEVSTPVAEAVEAPSVEGEEKKSKKRKREGEKDKKKKKSKKGKTDEKVEKAATANAEPAPQSRSEVLPSEEKTKTEKAKKDKSKEKKSKKESKEERVKAADNGIEAAKKEKKEKRKDKKSETDKKESKETEAKPDKTKSKKEKDGSSTKRKDKGTSETAVSSARSSSHDKPPPVERNRQDADRLLKTSRHMHRARFMAMKKASVLNPEALREILGVSA